MSPDSLFTTILRNKRAKFVLVGFLILTILRETGVLSINYNRSNISRSASTSWSVTSTGVGLARVNPKVRDSAVSLAGKERVAVYYHNDCIWGDCSASTVKAYISDLDHGILWMPLYKSAKFRATVNCNFSISRTGNDSGRKEVGGKLFSMNATITGGINIKGVCSAYTARQRILQSCAELIGNEITEKIQSETNPQ
ncbi:MAG: hypothetical protein ACKVOK_11940 [Flavobacteriales bacterium]